MSSVRWRKLSGDIGAAWGRLLALQVALVLALTAVGIVLGARTVLGREIRTSYLGTHPADATLDLPDLVDDALLARVRARADIEAADRRQMIKARVKPGPNEPWQMLVLFVAADFDALHLNTFRPQQGAWPPPAGTMLIERTAVPVIGGQRVILQMPHGAAREIAISGTVHDPGQAPAWQEHRGCAYITLDTLAALGEPPVLHELLVRFRPAPGSIEDVERRATALAESLRAEGVRVDEIRVPKLRQHPHQGLMNGAQLVMLGFSVVLLVLCGIVMATLLSAILARQVREIGVMKAIGASGRQIAAMYGLFVLVLGLVAVAIALPLAHLGATGMIAKVAYMMNLAITDATIPAWVYVAIALLGTSLPLACAALPIARATRISVRAALAQHGTGRQFLRPTRLPLPIRNALRKPARLAFTLVLLTVGGALVMTGANVQRGMALTSSKLADARRFDIEVRLHEPIGVDGLASLPGIRALEAWSAVPAAIARAGAAPDIMRTYPDGGHGSFTLAAPPDGGTTLLELPIVAGRWLVPGDTDSVVLGHGAARGAKVGDRVTITVEGRRSTWTVVGIAEEVGGSSAIVNPDAFRRATGITGASLLRIATTATSPAERMQILDALEHALGARNAAIFYAMPMTLMRSIIDDHIVLVTRVLIAMASLLGLVGLIALGSTMAINVAERSREIGIMKAIGAGDRRIFRIIAGEALFVGLASSLLAIVLSFPLTAFGARFMQLGMHATAPFEISAAALVGWPLAVALGSVVAALAPARRAVRLSVRAALGEI